MNMRPGSHLLLLQLLLLAFAVNVHAWSIPWFGGKKKVLGEVAELDETSLDELLATESISAVLFYAPWSPYSQHALPMWQVVAEKLALSNPPIPVGQIDAAKYPEVRVKHEIIANPTIKLFIDEEAFEFPLQEERTWANAVNWINERTNREQVVTNTEEMDAFLDENPLAVIGLFMSERDSQMFKKTSRHFDDVSFAVTYGSNSREMAQYLVKLGKIADTPTRFPTLVMLYQHDEKAAVYDGDMGDYHKVDQFILSRRVPMVTEFSAETADQIFSSGMPTIFLFRDPESEVGQQAEAALREASTTLRGSVVFALASDTNEPIQQQLFHELALENLEPSDFPTTRLVYRSTRSHQHRQYMDVKARKYRIDAGYGARACPPVTSPDHYRSFVYQYSKGMIKAYQRSEPLPVYYGNEPVVQAVGSNFQELVLNSPQDVLVDFYAPWCGHCRKFEPIYRSLGESLKPLRNTLRIVKIDATQNEVPEQITGFPTILLYPAGKKDTPVEFRQQRTVPVLTKFLKAHCTNPLTLSQEDPNARWQGLSPDEL